MFDRYYGSTRARLARAEPPRRRHCSPTSSGRRPWGSASN